MTDTLAAPASHLLDVRHSRFLAQAAPADAPTEAMDFIARVSDPDATHNCWAWRIGQDYRSSDDGEPAGTAGRPMLTALLHDDESAQRMADDRRSEDPGGTDLAQDNWDNEGGPVSIAASPR